MLLSEPYLAYRHLGNNVGLYGNEDLYGKASARMDTAKKNASQTLTIAHKRLSVLSIQKKRDRQ